MFRFVVEPYLHGVRIDTFLARHLRNHAVWRFQRLVRAGVVWINERTATSDSVVETGSIVRVDCIDPPETECPATSSTDEIELLHDDPWLCVINKPPGVVAHPVGRFAGDTLTELFQPFLDAQSAPGLLRAGIVHRLDRMTSGAMVIAKEHMSHRHLSLQFQQQRVRKTYLAIVHGVPNWQEKGVSMPIGQARDSLLMTTGASARSPRAAQTGFRLLRRYEAASLVEAEPKTGRVHQIRVHLSAIGHPLLGDEFYGTPASLALGSEMGLHSGNDAPRHALHARSLGFRHPISGENVNFVAALPGDLCDVISRL